MADYGGNQTAVRIGDRFWSAFRETAAREGIPYQWKALNDAVPDAAPSGCMRNFRIAAGREQGGHAGFVFQDSDAYKWLEGVAFSLRWRPDPALEAVADGAIAEIAAAQQPDGYLDTYYIINGLDKRWTNLKDHHELYCAGHMIEAAVAYYQATGKRVLLDAAIRLAAHIDSVIGPEEGKIHGYPGHPVIEMALMRLYGVTKDPMHLRLAKYFVDERGKSPLFFEEEDRRQNRRNYWADGPHGYAYYQAAQPVREQKDAVGHSVRAMYLYSGMADVARETGDESLKEACRTLWRSTARRRMYVTGAVGSTEYGEAFSFDYDLPSDTVYGETCAAIGLVFFARRMLSLETKGEYADVMERALYNGVLSGMQLDGKRFFYVNPLEVVPEACEKDPHKRHVKPERQKWFGCACCPPNLIRLLASLEDYVCSAAGDALYIHLYAGGEIRADVGGTMALSVETDYPWDGAVRVCVAEAPAGEKTLALRVPGWCRRWSLAVNGEIVTVAPEDGYVSLKRVWRAGDVVELALDMPARYVRSAPKVRENAGRVALTRGPVVYCLEEADNGAALHMVRAGGAPRAETAWRPDLLGGVVAITTAGLREKDDGWGETLYDDRPAPAAEETPLHWIPYYAWANRGVGEMRVWIRE
ncbi:MAG: glycoside hydrolase family 127 protein [Clostridia bacterium]|nr:glycoside hydrolase family 127 protein [Clostridia bacterium]